MIQYIFKRILQGIPVIIGVLTISFFLMNIAPGDPVRAMVGDYYSDDELVIMRKDLGLDQPLYKQYFDFMSRIISGNLGKSFISNRPVSDDLLEKIPFTLQLAMGAMCIAIPMGVTLGILAAMNRGKWIDRFLVVISLSGIAAPVFWIALLLILIIGIQLQWLPPTGFGGLKFLILPSIALGTRSLALLARTTRAYMLEVLKEDYIRTAVAKGVSTKNIILKHALRNVLIPLLPLLQQTLGAIFLVLF